MLVIGLTGGIASGKSTVAAAVRELGLPVFDADEASRRAVAGGSAGLEHVARVLGRECLTADGELDRARVAARVFSDAAARKKVESIIHRIVWAEAADFLARCREAVCRAAVLDVPLLIECGWQERVDVVWLVAVSVEEQVRRAMARSGMSETEARARIAAQLPLAEKQRFATVVFDNSGSLAGTLACVRREVAKIMGGTSEG